MAEVVAEREDELIELVSSARVRAITRRGGRRSRAYVIPTDEEWDYPLAC
jgi:hypothetical protein